MFRSREFLFRAESRTKINEFSYVDIESDSPRRITVCQSKKYEAVTKRWALSIFAAARSRVINPK